MERLRTINITDTVIQSRPITVTTELTEPELFSNAQQAESVYKRRKFVELMKQGLALPGGAIAGIGLRIIADTNFNTLEDYYQKPEFFLGLTLVGVGAMMVKRALDAVDKYDNAKIYLDKVKNWRNSFKTKKEKTVFEGPVQLTLDDELVQFERLMQAKPEQKAPVLEAREKTDEPSIVPEKEKRVRVRKPSVTGKSPRAKTPRRASRASIPEVEKVPQKNTDDKIDIRRHVRIRIDMIEEEDEELEVFGYISRHKCLENKCRVCRNSNLIFI